MQCAKAFLDLGHVKEALMSCDLYVAPDSSSSGKERPLTLDCVKMECLGTLQDAKGLNAFVEKV